MLRKSSSASSLEEAGRGAGPRSPGTPTSTSSTPTAAPATSCKRLSTRDFLASSGDLEEQQTWELVLASAAHDDSRITEKALDVVLLGHGDG